jgi:hypothetical protein
MKIRTGFALGLPLAGTVLSLAGALPAHAAITSPATEYSALAGPSRILLTLSGVGWFEWTTRAPGPWSLDAKPSDVDDLLKSLAGIRGTSLGSLSMPSPPGEADTAGLVPSDGGPATEAGLLKAMIGRQVSLEGPGDLSAKGTLLAVEASPEPAVGGRIVLNRTRLTIDTGGVLAQRVLEDLTSVTLTDPLLAGRVAKALQSIGARSSDSPVTVGIEGAPNPDGQASFAAALPVPLWKATYRLRAGGPGDPQGVLQGWAVVENATAADWTHVSMALQSGNPSSFTEALYARTDVARPAAPVDQQDHPLVGLDQRAIAPPMSAMAPAPALAPPPPGGDADEPMQKSLAMEAGLSAGASGSPPPAEGVGETFHLADPVTLAAGQTAELPFLSATLPVEKVDLLSEGWDHPVSALKVTNDTKGSWPAGPVSTSDGNGFSGDARMPATPPGESRMLAFAQDLRIGTKWEITPSRSLTSFSVSGGLAKIGIINRTTIVLTLAGAATAGDATNIVVEIPRTPGTTVHPEGAALADPTASSWRFATTVAPNTSNKVSINIDSKGFEAVQVADAPETLVNLASAAGGLPASAMAALAPMIALQKTAVERDQDVQALAQQRSDAFANEQRVRQNMQQFSPGDPQRNRYVVELQTSDDRIGSIDAQIAQARADAAEARRRLAIVVEKFRLGDD